jgi:energy-coupling factor transport system ATP-binding protein
MHDPIVSAAEFTYRYPDGSSPSLEDVSLDLMPGSFTVVAGESGSGKSTLLRACCGLVPHFHGGEVAGELGVGGLAIRDHGPGALAPMVGTVFQDPENQVVMGSVRAEIALPLEQRGDAPAAVARGVEEVALALGVAHLLDRRTETLSGGELQRVALAAALAHRPALLLLDEPTSQLDPVAGDELIWLLRRLNEEWGTAVVVAEHRLERCLGAADRVIALGAGRVVCDGAPREFLRWATEQQARGEGAQLATPVARLFSLAGLGPLPTSVKEARTLLRQAGLVTAELGAEEASTAPAPDPRSGPRPGAGLLRRRRSPAAIELRGVWHELRDGPAVLRGIDLRLAPGERVALMGRNGAGKSTLLRLVKGLAEPTRGAVERAGAVALLLQNPGDYLIHEHAVDEGGPELLAAAGLEGRAQANPRDLSGGERQRLALELVLAGGPYAAVCLDEPTRGMDRRRKSALARRIGAIAGREAAVVVATHDTEFAAQFADRTVLMGEGSVIADGPPGEVLAGGWHFSTEVARTLDGAGGALTPDQGLRLLRRELVS